MGITPAINIAVFVLLNPILAFLRVPQAVLPGISEYLRIIFRGLSATSLYNFFSHLLRALGNSAAPVLFLALSAGMNVGLDLLFVLGFHRGIAGAAWATVASQIVSGVGLMIYRIAKCNDILPKRNDFRFSRRILSEILNLSSLTCAQQSVMNFGILMVQGLVNSFGPTIMAAFAAAVKIDTFAYLPVQDFGNAYSTFAAQNFGAGNETRIREGTRKAFLISAVLSVLVVAFAETLMGIFVDPTATAIIAAGARYLRIEGAFYAGIGCLFLLYGYFRAIQKPMVSVVLTVISLGTRIALAYVLSAFCGETGVWAAIPIGWALADAAGLILMKRSGKKQGRSHERPSDYQKT